jgi:PPOX class probable FMN-dependent enzyme
MKTITDIAALEALYDATNPLALQKVTPKLTPLYRRWIDAARFVVLSTVGPEGTDGSPRGDDGPVVRIIDDSTIWMPDWRGNNRIDTLRNIVRDGRVSLMFMVPGSHNVVRVNGTTVLTDDPDVTTTFEQKGRHPKTVISITTGEVYFQCAKAVMRAGLWTRDDADGLPKAGEFLQEMKSDFDGATYDAGYSEYAKDKMW